MRLLTTTSRAALRLEKGDPVQVPEGAGPGIRHIDRGTGKHGDVQDVHLWGDKEKPQTAHRIRSSGLTLLPNELQNSPILTTFCMWDKGLDSTTAA